ncbi:MAG: 5'/3'-nucleotidase SurE [Acidimicrobiia bacterium]
MRVLVTNDDGVESAGIVALTRSLSEAGHDVFVVAPASDLSGAGASIGPLHRSDPIPVTEHHWAEVPEVPVLAIERPPATAVYLACLGAFGERPDIVASGINPGANTGHLILHSGTVGAALTAAGLGIPALAVSIKWSETGYSWETAARIAVPALEWVGAGEGAPRILNLNVPNVPLDEVLGVREATLAPYGEFWVASSDIRSGDLRIEFQGPAIQPDGATDAALVVGGYATVTPLLGIVAAPLKGAAKSVENALGRELRAQRH